MRRILGLLWIVSLSSRTTALPHVSPLDLHLLPYRWHYPTPVVVAPSAVERAALAVDHDAPSGRGTELKEKEKDKYGEDYILEEIEFTHEDIGHTGKLEYYIDEGIEYYDTDLFTSLYSGEKTPPKVSTNQDYGRQLEVHVLNEPRFEVLRGLETSGHNGRHFNTYGGSPDFQRTHQNADGLIAESGVLDLGGYSGQSSQDGRHFSHRAYQNTDRQISDSRVEGVDGNSGQNNEEGRHFNQNSGRPGYQTPQQSSDRSILNSRFQNQNVQDGRHFSQQGGSNGNQNSYWNTDRIVLNSRIQEQSIQDGQNFNKNGASIENEKSNQNTERTVLNFRIQHQNIQDSRNFIKNGGSSGKQISNQNSESIILNSRIQDQNIQDDQNFNKNGASIENETSNQNTERTVKTQDQNNQDGGRFNQHGDTLDSQTPHPDIEPSITTTSAVNGGHFVYKLTRRGQNLRGKLRARIENKDEIMEAVE